MNIRVEEADQRGDSWTVKEDVKFVGVREEGAEGGVRWRQAIHCEGNSPEEEKQRIHDSFSRTVDIPLHEMILFKFKFLFF